jgi:hypothetical protein
MMGTLWRRWSLPDTLTESEPGARHPIPAATGFEEYSFADGGVLTQTPRAAHVGSAPPGIVVLLGLAEAVERLGAS